MKYNQIILSINDNIKIAQLLKRHKNNNSISPETWLCICVRTDMTADLTAPDEMFATRVLFVQPFEVGH